MKGESREGMQVKKLRDLYYTDFKTDEYIKYYQELERTLFEKQNKYNHFPNTANRDLKAEKDMLRQDIKIIYDYLANNIENYNDALKQQEYNSNKRTKRKAERTLNKVVCKENTVPTYTKDEITIKTQQLINNFASVRDFANFYGIPYSTAKRIASNSNLVTGYQLDMMIDKFNKYISET